MGLLTAEEREEARKRMTAEWMTAERLTQRALAARLAISQAAVSRVLSGRPGHWAAMEAIRAWLATEPEGPALYALLRERADLLERLAALDRAIAVQLQQG